MKKRASSDAWRTGFSESEIEIIRPFVAGMQEIVAERIRMVDSTEDPQMTPQIRYELYRLVARDLVERTAERLAKEEFSVPSDELDCVKSTFSKLVTNLFEAELGVKGLKLALDFS